MWKLIIYYFCIEKILTMKEHNILKFLLKEYIFSGFCVYRAPGTRSPSRASAAWGGGSECSSRQRSRRALACCSRAAKITSFSRTSSISTARSHAPWLARARAARAHPPFTTATFSTTPQLQLRTKLSYVLVLRPFALLAHVGLPRLSLRSR